MPDFLVEQLHTFMRGHDHLSQHRLLLLQIGYLLLEIRVLLFLRNHAEFQPAKKRLQKGGGGLVDLLVYVLNLGLHRGQILPEELHQLVVLLQILVRLSGQVLNQAQVTNSVGRVLTVLFG
jgi:hypothetical protein